MSSKSRQRRVILARANPERQSARPCRNPARVRAARTLKFEASDSEGSEWDTRGKKLNDHVDQSSVPLDSKLLIALSWDNPPPGRQFSRNQSTSLKSGVRIASSGTLFQGVYLWPQSGLFHGHTRLGHRLLATHHLSNPDGSVKRRAARRRRIVDENTELLANADGASAVCGSRAQRRVQQNS